MALAHRLVCSAFHTRPKCIHRSLQLSHIAAVRAPLLVLSLGALSVLGCLQKAGLGEECGIGLACADGLACSEGSGTCITALPPTPICDPLNSGCTANRDAYVCYYGGQPSDPYETECALAPNQDNRGDDEALYCCTFVPHCETLLDYILPSDKCADVGLYGSGWYIGCNDPVSPQQGDSGLQCVAVDSSGGYSYYCCRSENACFFAATFPCANAGQPVECTGGATPDQFGLACAVYEPDAGPSGTYCCTTDAGSD